MRVAVMVVRVLLRELEQATQVLAAVSEVEEVAAITPAVVALVDIQGLVVLAVLWAAQEQLAGAALAAAGAAVELVAITDPDVFTTSIAVDLVVV